MMNLYFKFIIYPAILAIKILRNYLGGARFARTKRGKVVRFSGFARKTNHLSTFFASEASKKHLNWL
jgi:hypothetical protein